MVVQQEPWDSYKTGLVCHSLWKRGGLMFSGSLNLNRGSGFIGFMTYACKWKFDELVIHIKSEE